MGSPRFPLVVLVLSALVTGCSIGGGDGDRAADETEDSIGVDGPGGAVAMGPPTVTTGGGNGATGDAAAGLPDGGAGSDDEAEGQAADPASLDARIERLIAGQEALGVRLDSLSDRLAASANPPSVAGDSAQAADGRLGAAREHVRNFGVGIVLSVIVLAIVNFTVRGLVWLLDTLAERNARRRLFYKRLVPIVRILLWSFAAYFIVRVIFQVDAQGIVAAAAAVGVAVGFAAQDLLKNLFGGFILVFDQPFQAGDKISVGGTYGEVVSIGLRSTRLVTPDDNLVSVPNAQVVDQQVANANAGELHCQVVTDLYLPGWADEAAAKSIAYDAAAGSKYVYLNKPIVVLVSDVFKETFLTRVRVKAYVLDPRLEFLLQSDVTERARAGFREAGLLRPEHFRHDLVYRTGVLDSAPATPSGGPNGER